MTFAPRPIDLALVVSALLHLGLLFGQLASDPPPPPPPPLQARLQLPPPAPAPEPVQMPQAVEETTPEPPPPPKTLPPPKATARPLGWQAVAQKQLQKLKAEGLLYSRESIAAHLEGTVVLLLVLDANGRVGATRVQESSGHPLLDRDARAAAMRLTFPPDAPGEFEFAIRFRLK